MTTTTTTTTSSVAVDPYADPALEGLLGEHGLAWARARVPTRQVAWDASNAAQVRPVDPDVVERYAGNVADGAVFPAVLAAPTAGSDGLLVVVGGMHRAYAHAQAGVDELEAYVLAEPLDELTALLVGVGHNRAHGLPLTNDEACGHAATLIDRHGLSVTAAAEACGVTAGIVRRAVSAAAGAERAERLGVAGLWKRIGSRSAQAKLHTACRHDQVFAEAVTTAAHLRLPHAKVAELTAEAGEADSIDEALDAIEAYEADELEQRSRPRSRRPAKNPAGEFAGAALQLVGLDPADIADRCPTDRRAWTAELATRLAGQLHDLADRLARQRAQT